MNNPVTQFLRAIAVGSVAILAQTALSQVVGYNNYNGVPYSGDFFNYAGLSSGNYTGEAGNEIGLAGSLSTYTVTGFTAEFDFLNSGGISGNPAGGETVDLRFYANTGGLVSGYPSPAATPFFDSTPVLLSSITGFSGFTTGMELDDTGLNITGVPKDFTWTLTFANLGPNETAGLALYGPPSVGANSGDSWINTTGGWTLETATGSTPLEYGAEIGVLTTVPEPNTIALGIVGACALFAARRKK